MITEAEIRDLLGYSSAPELTFLGTVFQIRPDGLGPLIRFARTSVRTGEEDEAGEDDESVTLAAAHRLLEDCLEDFQSFARLAMESKAGLEVIQAAVRHLIEFYCARMHWSAMRLIGYVAHNLDEVDGQLLWKSGRGVASLSAREACNLALAICLDGRDEDSRATFLEDLNYEGNAEAEAMAMAKQMMAASAAPAAEAPGGRGGLG